MSVSVENFIKTIYKLEQMAIPDLRPGAIADALQISNAATTDMAKKLAARDLISYTKYQPISLTPKGRQMALSLIRKHRLWESFLHKVLDLSLHEIHREAEMLEHQTSDFLADKIDKHLNNPSFDPHGDPIPEANGHIVSDDTQILLSEANAGNKYRIARLYSSDKDFFDFCSGNGLAIGALIKVKKQYENSNMTEISINGKHMVLNHNFSNLIYLTNDDDNQ